MKKAFIMCVIGFCSISLFGNLTDYLPVKDKRFNSFYIVRELIKSRELKTWVETGTARFGDQNCVGDGCSTMIYTDYLRDLPGEIYSVDIDPKAIQQARQALKYSKDKANFHVGDSIAFLRDFDKQIDFLYLDSYDFDLRNPLPSQQHHLYEIMAAYDKLHDRSVIMVDDCELPHGGKGKLVIQYLLDRGWIIVYKGYQVILVKNV